VKKVRKVTLDLKDLRGLRDHKVKLAYKALKVYKEK
jgi:hypothetical protein